MTDLFTLPTPEFDETDIPEISESDSNLNFVTAVRYTNQGLGAMDDPEPYNSYEITLPKWSGITNSYNNRPFTIATSRIHYSGATLVNEWLKTPENAASEAGKWILANADKLNAARRWWSVKRLKMAIAAKKRMIEDAQREVQRMEVGLAVQISEVQQGYAFTEAERALKVKEFGGDPQEDL